ncbi:MAG: helix-turn-helix domain-containing protein [Actinobacteria bacterium]|nr:helix-turn-helix domain-containing protein [Actinomycetota bacterium]
MSTRNNRGLVDTAPAAARGGGGVTLLLHAAGAGRAGALLRDVATELAEQADEIASTMMRAYEAEIPAYATIGDQALKDDVHAVSSAMVRCWLHVMSTGEQLNAELLMPMTQGARRRAAQGIDLQSMLRAYRVGIRVMWTEITASPVWRGQVLQGVMAQVATWALDFADRSSTAVAAAYLEETEQLAREREHRRSALLNVILAGPVSEPIDQPEELELRHSVAVARVAPDMSLLELERTGQLLEERVGASLWTVRHQSVVAAVPLQPAVGRDGLIRLLGRLVHEQQIVAIGLGGRAEGVAETRQSYSEAISALRIGPLLGTATSHVHDFQELGPLIALVENPERARRFAQTALEPLGDLSRRATLLPTLEAYLVHQGRLKQAAADLGVHLNTIKYRLKDLRPFIDPAITDGSRATTLLLAIRILHVLEADAASRTGGTVR